VLQRMKYPQPGDIGGRLIRSVIQFLKKQGIPLPLTSHILIAVSGGPDSLALAQLIIKYGRRVGAAERVSILHINHQWRDEESDADAEQMRIFAARAKIPFILEKLKPPASYRPGESWENLARLKRKEIYRKLSKQYQAVVLTAHHGDDLAETILWRIFTGASDTHLEGIRFQDGPEIKPLLNVRKKMLIDFLREEGIAWSEDATNHEERFLRARMRKKLIPPIEEIFPRAIEHLMNLGLSTEKHAEPLRLALPPGIRVKRAHYMSFIEKQLNPNWEGEIALPKGWKLVKSSK